MSWLALITALVKVVGALANWMHDQKMIDAGTNAAIVKGMQDADDAISRAKKARDLVRADIARDGDSRVRDDGFRRPD